MGLKCRISQGPAGSVTVYNQDGSISQLYNQLENYFQDTDSALEAWAMTQSEEFVREYPQKEIGVQDVLKYMDTVSSEDVQLSKEEVRGFREVMNSYGFSSLSELHEKLTKIFKPNGIIEMDTDLAIKSKMFTEANIKDVNLDEISELLIRVEGQLRLYDIEIETTEQGVTDTSRKTLIGNHPKVPMSKVNEDVVNLLTEHANNEAEFMDKVTELPYPDVVEKLLRDSKYRNEVMEDLAKLTVVPQVSINGNTLSRENQTVYSTVRNTVPVDTDTKLLEAKLRYLQDTSPIGWGNIASMQKVLKGVVDSFIGYNVDLVGLEKLVGKPLDVVRLVESAIQMLESPSQSNFKSFAELKQELLPDNQPKRIENLPGVYKGYSIVSLYTTKTDQELFDMGLIRVGEDLFHKVNLESKAALYEYIYEMYTQGRIDIPSSLKSVEDINDPANKVEVLKDIEKFIGSRKTGIEVSNNELLSLYQVAFEHAPLTRENPSKRLSKVTSVTTEVAYLPTDFIADFYNYQLREKAKDSEIYRNVLSKFLITDKDITLVGKVDSIEGIEVQRDLEEYIRVRKDSTMDHLLLEKRGNFTNSDLVAVNFPETVKEYTGEVITSGNFVVTPIANIDFIKVDGELYRKVADNTEASLYVKTPVNKSEAYFQTEIDYSYDRKAADTLLDNVKLLPESMTIEEFDKQLSKAKFENKTKKPLDNRSTTQLVVEYLKEKIGLPIRILSAKQMEQSILEEEDSSILTMTMPGGEQVQVKPVNAEVVNGFYSPLEKIITEAKQDKMPAKQWVDKFARGEEAKWTGLTDWLSQQQGSVSKADIQKYLKENRIQISEVVLEAVKEEGDVMSKAEAKKVFEDNGYDVITDSNGDTYVEKDEEAFDYNDMSELEQDAFAVLTRNNLDSVVKTLDNTKYSEYQLEGEKSDYKEVLITMPQKKTPPDSNVTIESREDLLKDKNNYTAEENEGYFVVTGVRGASKSIEKGYSTPTKEVAIEQYIEDELSYQRGDTFDVFSKEGRYIETVMAPTKERAKEIYIGRNTKEEEIKFRSSHFSGTANILVHLRMNTRTDAQGNKVLFLEEVQSDWGQKGKKEGFANEKIIEEREKLRVLVQNKKDKVRVVEDKIKNLKPLTEEEQTKIKREIRKLEERRYEVRNNRDWEALGVEIAEREDALSEYENTKNILKSEIYELRYIDVDSVTTLEENLYEFDRKNSTEGTPTAPFVTDTNAWTKLGLKVALKESIAQGATKIAWTTGEQQSGRYSLEKVADEVRYSKNADGTYKVVAYKNGENVSEDKALKEDKLEATLGKDIAQRIIDNVGEDIEGEKSLTGESLKVGGKGMKGFYGNPADGSIGIVGGVAEKLFRQKVGTVEISQDAGTPKNRFAANAVRDELPNTVNISTQHSIDITPELKAQVEQGLPLFMKRGDKVHGFYNTNTGEVFLTEEFLSSESLVHELYHAYKPMLKQRIKQGDLTALKVSQRLRQAALDLVGDSTIDQMFEAEGGTTIGALQSEVYSPRTNETKEQYKERIIEEVEAIIMQENSVEYFEKIAKENNLTEEQTKSFLQKVQDFIKDFSDWIVEQFGLTNVTPEQVATMTQKELLDRVTTDMLQQQKENEVPVFDSELLDNVVQILDSKIKIFDMYSKSEQAEINERVEDCN